MFSLIIIDYYKISTTYYGVLILNEQAELQELCHSLLNSKVNIQDKAAD